ncbi:MAG TPA: PAS domain-containing sensor histidine kinase [Verrucomicrobiae bacterium]|nr:PAS domain-containing sensor histidine kinase [Verrucomicrobiae bacterium]
MKTVKQIKLAASNQNPAMQAKVEPADLYRLLVESIQDYAIFLLDTNGMVMSWNAGAQKLKGYKANEIIGKHFSVFFLPKDRKDDKPRRELEAARQQGSTEEEGWRLKKDGDRFWANVILTALYDNSGHLQGYAKVTRDLSERKQAEDNLKQANRELQKQQKKLEQLGRAREAFFSIVSHELRNPATVVKQYLGIMLAGYGGPLNPTQIDYLQKANNSNDRQIVIANDLIKVAQVDAGKIVLHKKPTDVTELIELILSEHADMFHGRSQHGSFEAPPAPIIAEVDPARLRMVIENLLTNASKYTPKGGEVSVSVGPSGDKIHISISDTGVGIKNTDMSKLFKQFSRIPNELSEHVGGSGLGLYWVNKVVQLHKGRIAVHSKVGQGSRFDIYIPGGKSHGDKSTAS